MRSTFRALTKFSIGALSHALARRLIETVMPNAAARSRYPRLAYRHCRGVDTGLRDTTVGDDFISSHAKIRFRDSFPIPRRCRLAKRYRHFANGDNVALFCGCAQTLRAFLDPCITNVTIACHWRICFFRLIGSLSHWLECCLFLTNTKQLVHFLSDYS